MKFFLIVWSTTWGLSTKETMKEMRTSTICKILMKKEAKNRNLRTNLRRNPRARIRRVVQPQLKKSQNVSSNDPKSIII